MDRQLKVSYTPIGDIIPYAQNARAHSEKQIGQIENSLKEFGFISPVLVDKEGILVASHTRILAAERIGLELIPTIRPEDLTPKQVRAYRLADNKLAENADWHQDVYFQ